MEIGRFLVEIERFMVDKCSHALMTAAYLLGGRGVFIKLFGIIKKSFFARRFFVEKRGLR